MSSMPLDSSPTDDLPSTEEHACDLGGCSEPWAFETERRNGPRKLRLCEEHATRWLLAERELLAEIEAVAGRVERRPRPGTAKALATVGRGADKRRQRRRA